MQYKIVRRSGEEHIFSIDEISVKNIYHCDIYSIADDMEKYIGYITYDIYKAFIIDVTEYMLMNLVENITQKQLNVIIFGRLFLAGSISENNYRNKYHSDEIMAVLNDTEQRHIAMALYSCTLFDDAACHWASKVSPDSKQELRRQGNHLLSMIHNNSRLSCCEV